MQALKERVYKTEKDIQSIRSFEKFIKEYNANTSKILDLVQVDVAKLRKDGGDGGQMMSTMHKELEEFKKKIDEQHAQGLKKLAYNDRKQIDTINNYLNRSDSDQSHA